MVLDRWSLRVLAVLLAAGLSAVSFLVTLSGSDAEFAALEALTRALLVAAPLGVGMYLRWGPPPLQRFGAMLLVAGVAFWLTTLAASDAAVPYSIGRVCGWATELYLWYLALTYPTGRLEHRVDRALVVAGALLLCVLYLPTALLVESYPDPSPWTACGDACPRNAFFVLDAEPAWVGDVVEPLRVVLTIGLYFAVAYRLAGRVRAASPLMRRMLTPVAQVAALRFALTASAVLVRFAAPDADDAVRTIWWLSTLASIAFSVAFLVGALRWRLFIGRCLQRLTVVFRARASRAELGAALAEAFEDPELKLVEPTATVSPGPGCARTDIRTNGDVLAVVVHDEAAVRRAGVHRGSRLGGARQPRVPAARSRDDGAARGAGEVARAGARRRRRRAAAHSARPPRRRPTAPTRAARATRAGGRDDDRP
jgi:hypothetical protein